MSEAPSALASSAPTRHSRMQSRLGRRCCLRRKVKSSSEGVLSTLKALKLPEPPLVIAGAIGGPLCMALVTPLRTALSLASQKPEATAGEIYMSILEKGVANAWTGAVIMLLTSCPMFLVIGPVYHFCKERVGAVMAVILAAVAESIVTYGPQTVTAQMAFSRAPVSIAEILCPFGPGVLIMTLRNAVAMSGIRLFSEPCQKALLRLWSAVGLSAPMAAVHLMADFGASALTSILSAPLNQLYTFAVVSSDYQQAGYFEKLPLCWLYLSKTYLLWNDYGQLRGISSTLPRDLMMRCVFHATLMTLFAMAERVSVSLWERWDKMGSVSPEELPRIVNVTTEVDLVNEHSFRSKGSCEA